MPNLVEKTFPDHPQTPDRILSIQEEIAHAAAEERVCDPHAGVRRREGETGAHREQAQTARWAEREEAVAASPNDQNGQNGENGDDDRSALHRRDN